MADDVKNVEDAKQLQNANTEEIQRGEAWNVQHIESRRNRFEKSEEEHLF